MNQPPGRFDDEIEAIRARYARRATSEPVESRFFGYENLAHVMRIQDRYRETLRLLHGLGFHPLVEKTLLDVGCGDGRFLGESLLWGMKPANVAGIELRTDQVVLALGRMPNVDVRVGSGTELPWPDAAFDIVGAHTVFTSILDRGMRSQVASEMQRVVKPGGAILWYDFTFDNPKNPDVRGIKQSEVRALFPTFKAHLRRISLAPPIARRLPGRLLAVGYPLLASIPPLRTHCLGVLVKPA